MKDFFLKYFKYFILGALIYMPIFGFLNTFPIRIWDEARLAINAYEMLNNGNFIVTHYNGVPDMWSTKPPLMIWLQVLSMKFFGVNELSVRFPSAFAALFTCVVLIVFALKYLKQFWFGFIAVIVLITTHGYIDVHVTRTGDYDSLLTLFTTLSGLLFFAFIETKKNKFLYLFFIFITFAVLTKSVAGLLFVPALLIYSLIQKQFIAILKNKHFYFGLLVFLIITLGYYFHRELKNPGYFDAVMQNELGGRYLNSVEGHEHSFLFFYNNIIDFQLSSWYLLVPCGLLIGLFTKNSKINRITVFSFLMILFYLLVISFAQTKLQWYNAPIFPFLAILIAVFIEFIFHLIQDSDYINQTLKINILPYIFLFLITIAPYKNIVNKTYKPQESSQDKEFYEIGYFLQDAVKGKCDIDGYYLLFDGYNAQIQFYLNILNDKGINISFKDWKNLDSGDKVITYQNNVKQYINEHYTFEKISEIVNVQKNKIIYEK